MQDVRGDRFFVPLDDEHIPESASQPATSASPFALVNDVLERPSGVTAPPAPPRVRSSGTGFPEHRKRTRQSVFKQRQTSASDNHQESQDGQVSGRASQHASNAQSFEQADRVRIDQENRDKLSQMTPEEIAREREELFSGLSPALIQKLLKRSTIDDQSKLDASEKLKPAEGPTVPTESKKNVTSAQRDRDARSGSHGVVQESQSHEERTTKLDEAGPPEPVDAPSMISNQLPSTHFPRPPEPPDLDPRSESFLSDLHEKYFPNLAHDPNKLSWMQPSSSDDTRSPYHPSHLALPAAALRFNFRGQMLPPNLSRQIPVSAGLHHHGDAPEAAGYTIPELAHLARSSNASQRCIAFQTAGRILYRLGIGEFGKEDDESEEIAALSRGLWDTVEESGIIQIMAVEAAKEKGHLSARAYAQEALWNWRKGGGRKRKAQ